MVALHISDRTPAPMPTARPRFVVTDKSLTPVRGRFLNPFVTTAKRVTYFTILPEGGSKAAMVCTAINSKAHTAIRSRALTRRTLSRAICSILPRLNQHPPRASLIATSNLAPHGCARALSSPRRQGQRSQS
jgi:hypothetical protein